MNRISHILIAIVIALAFAGCRSNDEPAPEPQSRYAIKLYINAGGGTTSRAPGNEDQYNGGEGYENYIDIAGGDFRVVLYNSKDQWLANLEQSVLTPLSPDWESSKRYELVCQISNDLAQIINDAKDIKIVLLANWRHNYPFFDGGTLDKLFDAASQMDYTAGLPGPVLEKKDKIALFGVNKYEGVVLEPETTTDLSKISTLHLIRSLAKIEVWDHAETSFPMASVSLTRHNTQAMPMPKGVTEQADYVKDNYDGDYVLYPSFKDGTDNEVQQNVLLTKVTDPESKSFGHYIIYVPEYKNKGRLLDQQARLKVTYDEFETTHYIEFQDNKKQPIDILRNYWYQFEIRKIREDIIVTVQVVPYAEVDLKPDFGISDEKAHYIPLYDDDTLVGYYDPRTGLYFDIDKTTVIPNPMPGIDPGSNRKILTDKNGIILYYYDDEKGYFAPDNATNIENPYKINEIYDQEADITTVKRKDNGIVLWHYKPLAAKFLAASNKECEISYSLVYKATTLTMPDGASQIVMELVPGIFCLNKKEGSNTTYYLDTLTGNYYADFDTESATLSNPVEDPFK